MGADKFPHFSGMDFTADDTYVIESSPGRLACGDNVRSVEFVRRKDDGLLFVEAKATLANPENSPESYEIEIGEICKKFIHSLNLLSAVRIGVVEDILPDGFVEPGKVMIKFLLVIREHEPKWCKPVKSTIEQELPEYIKKIWRPEVFVINHSIAKQAGIATA